MAYTLQGSALLHWRDAVRGTLEQQLRSAIVKSVLQQDGASVTTSYTGCQVFRWLTAARVLSSILCVHVCQFCAVILPRVMCHPLETVSTASAGQNYMLRRCQGIRALQHVQCSLQHRQSSLARF